MTDEVTEARLVLLEAHVENLITRVYELERRLGDEPDISDDKSLPCLAARYDGTPIYEGPHQPHLFTYGPHGVHVGNCGGRP
jgi:hypothetical protein